jgi:hypothetical protein
VVPAQDEDFAGDEPQVPKPVRLTLIDDKDALRMRISAVGRAAWRSSHPRLARRADRRSPPKRCATSRNR